MKRRFLAALVFGATLLAMTSHDASGQYGGPYSVFDGQNYVERGAQPRQVRRAVAQRKQPKKTAITVYARQNTAQYREVSYAGIPAGLRAAVDKMKANCSGVKVISSFRRDSWGAHRLNKAVDVVMDDYNCGYAQLRDFRGGVSRDALTMNFNPRHIHLSEGGGEDGCWFNHMPMHGGTGGGPRCAKLIHAGGSQFRQVVWADEVPAVVVASLDPVQMVRSVVSSVERVVEKVSRRFGPQAGKMAEMLGREAERTYGIDPKLQNAIAYMESTWRPQLVSVSNARGLCQTIGKFWVHLKIPSNPTPEEQAKICATVTAENIGGLRDALEREPTPSEVYMAHWQGVRAAVVMIQADDKAHIVPILDDVYGPGHGWKVLRNNPVLQKTPTVGAFRSYLDRRVQEALRLVSA